MPSHSERVRRNYDKPVPVLTVTHAERRRLLSAISPEYRFIDEDGSTRLIAFGKTVLILKATSPDAHLGACEEPPLHGHRR